MCKQCCVALEGCTAPKRQPQHLSLRQQQKRANFIHRQLRYQHCQLLLPHFAEALPQCSTSLGLCHKKGSMYSRTLQEEHDFQAGITVSLGLPALAAVSITPPASSSHHSLSIPIPRASSSAMTTPNHLHTLPYHPPNITHHMNSDWMRPFEDRSKETPKRRKRDPNQRFRLVFCREVCCSKCYGWLPTDIVIPCESIHRFFLISLLSTNFSVMAHPPYAPRDFELLFSTYDLVPVLILVHQHPLRERWTQSCALAMIFRLEPLYA